MNVTIINTGGTFNKRYNPISGELEVPNDNQALSKILKACHNNDFELKNILAKDSLEMDEDDRVLIKETILQGENENVIIIHGTDTMEITAYFLSQEKLSKKVVLIGSMIPMSIDAVEATLNFSLALGFLNASVQEGIYIAMHGVVKPYEAITKDKTIGQFIVKNSI